MATRRRGGTIRGRAPVMASPKSTPKKSIRSKPVQRTAVHPRADDLASRLKARHRTLATELAARATFVDTVRALNATLDPAGVAETIIERMAGWVPAPAWAVVSVDLSGRLIVLADRALPARLRPLASEVARWTVTHGVPFLSPDLGGDPRLPVAGAVSVAALPLQARGHAVGAVVGIDLVRSTTMPQLRPDVAGPLAGLLEAAAAALDNTIRLQRVEALSVTDDLTGLYNSRYLNMALRRESKRAVRSGRPLSLLFLDLDGFKTVNDAHGHLLGSRALVETAEVVRSCSRETDIVARFGGDEFAVILPDTGGQGASAVAERVRERLAAFRFLAAEGLNVRLTVSVGVATLPEAALSAEALIEAADAAMYRVKDRGKNGIATAAVPADI